MLGNARLPSPPYARTDVSGNARRTSATVRAPDRSMSSRLITLTDAGVVLEGWGRFPGTMTSGSSNVGGSCGWDSGTCANASWIETAPTTTATHKNAQRPTRPLGPWCSIPPTSLAAKACGAGPYQLDSQARRLDDTYPVKLVRAGVRAGLLAPGSLSVSGLPKRPALIRRRRSVACHGEGLPGYSGATAPELHRTSLHPHSRRSLQRPRRVPYYSRTVKLTISGPTVYTSRGVTTWTSTRLPARWTLATAARWASISTWAAAGAVTSVNGGGRTRPRARRADWSARRSNSRLMTSRACRPSTIPSTRTVPRA